MKCFLIGKRMFIADLMLVSIWALFAWRGVGCGLVMTTMIVMRIILSFELFKKSRWALLSTLMFAILYVACFFSMPATKYVDEPINKFIYVCLCLLGQSDLAIVSFHTSDSPIPDWLLWSIRGIIDGWLVLMPIISSLCLNGCFGLLIRKCRLWWYLAFVTSLTILFWFEVRNLTIFAFAGLMMFMPLVYGIIYGRRKRHLLHRVLRDKVLMGYAETMAVFYIAVIIGLCNIEEAKLLASFILPVALYIVANRLTNSAIRTIPAVMFGLGGIFFMNCYNRSHEIVIASLCIGMILTLIGVILTTRNSWKISSAILIFIANGILLPVFLLGYNPYAVIDADYVNLMRAHYPDISNGVYEFSENGYLGVRDRYGVVIPPKYDKIYPLKGTTDYLVLTVGKNNSPEYHLQVFDLYTRENVIPENKFLVTDIRTIDSNKYALLDKNDEQVYTLCLTSANHYSTKYDAYFAPRTNSPYIVKCKFNEYNDPRTKFSSNLKEAEKKLIEIYEQKEYCDRELMDLLQTNIKTLSYPFRKLQQKTNITITTSPDKKVRLYSWNTGQGGTSPDYQTYIQYQTGDTVLTRTFYPIYDSKYVFADDIRKDGNEIFDNSFCDVIYQISMKDGKNAYLITAYNKSGAEGEQESILIYEKNGGLEKLPFIDRKGNKRFSVYAYYSIPDWYFTTDGLGWNWVMSFDSKTNTLYVPYVPDSDYIEMSDRYALYRYDNGKMKYIGNDAGFWLHPSLKHFKSLAGIYQTDTELIRIDELKDDSFRYSAWPKSKPMSSKPELVMTGGKCGIVKNAIVFKNGDYTYIVPEYRRGQGDDFGKVIIKYKNKVIQESEV